MSELVEITTVGSCNMDLCTYAAKLPVLGETICGTKYSVGYGGKGANQCVAAAKLGASTAHVSIVGNDHNGNGYIKNMQDFNINTKFMLQTSQADTGVASITIAENGQNCIIIVPGANLLLSVEDVEKARSIIESSKVLLCQMEIDIKPTTHALKIAQCSNVTTILNLTPAAEIDEEVYKYCDILCINETEAEFLTKEKIETVKSAKEAANNLLKRGCKSCLITLGSQGCVYCDKTSKAFHVPIENSVEAVDTTGAGDCFIGALAYFIACHPNLKIEDKLRRANIVAAYSVTKPGTQSSYPEKHDLPKEVFM